MSPMYPSYAFTILSFHYPFLIMMVNRFPFFTLYYLHLQIPVYS